MQPLGKYLCQKLDLEITLFYNCSNNQEIPET